MLITSLSLFSFSDEGESKIWFPHLDKIVHFTFHLGIMVLGYLMLLQSTVSIEDRKRKVQFLLLFSLCYGLLIEGLQWLMPYDRSAEISDVLANSLGAITGGLLIQWRPSLFEGLK